MSGHRPRPARGRGPAARRCGAAVVLLLTAALALVAPAPVMATDPVGGSLPPVTAATPGPVKPGYSTLVNRSAVLQPVLADGSARHTVFVRLAGEGVAELSAGLLAKGESGADVRLAVTRARATIGLRSVAVAAAAKAVDPGSATIFQVANAIPGLGITANPAALRALATLPDVARISEIVPKTPAGTGPPQLASALRSWTDLGVTGSGVRVGVIDTGIDYTAADFGGPGSPVAHDSAGRTNRWAPTAQVAGGFDFVGDSYDAAARTTTGAANPGYQPVPHPDANPLDCSGHGTTVAGAIAGRGVDAAGQTFGGRYATLAAPALDSLRVAPGVAPQATLYALKVFGCSGATDAVIPALDWALDPNGDGDFSDHLDVVDLSLTGPSDATDDPENAVLDAVAQLGVLPVMATTAAADAPTNGSVRALAARSQVSAEWAGVAALVQQARPSWTPEQVKASVINAAGRGPAGGGAAGTGAPGGDAVGQVDAAAAVSTTVLAYSSTSPGAVSVSFGAVEADVRQPSLVQTSAVVVQNTGGDDADLTLSYRQLVGQPGVSYQVSPSHLVLPPGTSALATVVMTITPAALRHILPPGVAAQQTNVLTGLDEARQYRSTTSGSVLVAGESATVLQVPVDGSARPISTTTAADGRLGGRAAVVLSGTGLSSSSPSDPVSTGYNSMVSVLNLGYRSTEMPNCAGSAARQLSRSSSGTVSPGAPSATGATPSMRSDCSASGDPVGDLQAVGAGRTAAGGTAPGYLWFGLSTYGDWTSVGDGIFPTVNIDTNGDNTADYTVQVQSAGGNSDLLYALLFDDAGAGSLVDIYPVNFNLGNVDTNVFDTNVLLIPVNPAAIGYRPSMTSFPIRYSIATYSAYGAPQNSGTVDTTPAITFDVAGPPISTASPLWRDQGGVGISYQLAPGLTSADALVLHLHAGPGSRAQVVALAGDGG